MHPHQNQPVNGPSWFALAAAASLLLSTAPAPAAGTEPTAEQIAKDALARNSGAYANLKATIKMTVNTAQGDKKVRELEVRSVKTKEGLMRTILTCRSPADVAGTAFLMMQSASGLSEQHMYLPTFKKVKSIPPTQTTQSFMGSDFTFLELNPVMLSQADGQVAFNRLPDGVVDGEKVYVVEVLPNLKGAPYKRVLVHVDKNLLAPRKIEFFDAVGAAAKVLNVRQYKSIKGAEGTIAVPAHTEMVNLQKKSSTVLELMDVTVVPPPNPDDFTPAALQKSGAASPAAEGGAR